MITVSLSLEQAKTVEDALSWLAVSFPKRNTLCSESYLLILNARHDLKVKEMLAENSNVDWLNDPKETA